MNNVVSQALSTFDISLFRADLNKMMMSMSVGPFCSLDQDVDSKDWRTGAVVAIKMDENERECEQIIYLSVMCIK